jgi:hypothetical protein
MKVEIGISENTLSIRIGQKIFHYELLEVETRERNERRSLTGEEVKLLSKVLGILEVSK